MGMQEWSLDIINSYCGKVLDGRFDCELTANKGRIMVAHCSVRQGELLFEEDPLHLVLEDDNNEAFKLVRNLCKSDRAFDYDTLWYWAALNSLTESQCDPPPRVGTLGHVTEEQHKRLLALYHEPVQVASAAVQKLVSALELGVDPVLVEELLHVWILNCFEHSEDPLGYSAYFASSFVSHSCYPNAIWSEGDNGVHVLRARRDIAAGEEITISYLEEDVLLQSAESRKECLRTTKQFECTCERCAPNGGADADLCRGFMCSICGKCGIFYRLVNKNADGFSGVLCTECKAPVSKNEASRLLKVEKKLKGLLGQLGDSVHKAASRVEALERHMSSDPVEGGIGLQHYLSDKACEMLVRVHTHLGHHANAREAMQKRVDYQRKAYPGLSGTFAWTLEAQGELILEHLNLHSGTYALKPDMGEEQREDLSRRVFDAFDEGLRVLKLMFGTEHEYYSSLLETRGKAAEQLRPCKDSR